MQTLARPSPEIKLSICLTVSNNAKGEIYEDQQEFNSSRNESCSEQLARPWSIETARSSLSAGEIQVFSRWRRNYSHRQSLVRNVRASPSSRVAQKMPRNFYLPARATLRSRDKSLGISSSCLQRPEVESLCRTRRRRPFQHSPDDAWSRNADRRIARGRSRPAQGIRCRALLRRRTGSVVERAQTLR